MEQKSSQKIAVGSFLRNNLAPLLLALGGIILGVLILAAAPQLLDMIWHYGGVLLPGDRLLDQSKAWKPEGGGCSGDSDLRRGCGGLLPGLRRPLCGEREDFGDVCRPVRSGYAACFSFPPCRGYHGRAGTEALKKGGWLSWSAMRFPFPLNISNSRTC